MLMIMTTKMSKKHTNMVNFAWNYVENYHFRYYYLKNLKT